MVNTLPETNIAPEKKAIPKGNEYSNHPFLGAMLVSGRVYQVHIPYIRCGWEMKSNYTLIKWESLKAEIWRVKII